MNPLVTRALETVRTQGPGALVVKGARYPLKPLLVARAARELAARSETAETTGDQIRLVESFRYAGIEVGSWQIRSEIEALLELLRSEQPKTVLEIGTAEGGTFFLFTRVAAPDALLLTLDLPGGDFGGSYPRWRVPLYESFARDRQRVHVLRGDSHAPATLADVQRRLEGRQLDFLFVDGDHSYDGVRRDLEMYGPLVRPGGLIGFHDIVPGGVGKHGDPGEVPRFWSELKQREQSNAWEYVNDWEWGSCGIGVLRKQEPAAASAAPADESAATASPPDQADLVDSLLPFGS